MNSDNEISDNEMSSSENESLDNEYQMYGDSGDDTNSDIVEDFFESSAFRWVKKDLLNIFSYITDDLFCG